MHRLCPSQMKKQARRAAKVVVFDEVAARIRKASRLAEVKVSLNYFFRFCDKEHRGAITGRPQHVEYVFGAT